MGSLRLRLERFFIGYFLDEFCRTQKHEVSSYSSLLDIGCGYNPYIKDVIGQIGYTVGLDAFEPSIEKAKQEQTHSEFILADVSVYLEKIESKSFDEA
jgi:predicted TPR repeat methyltransferase